MNHHVVSLSENKTNNTFQHDSYSPEENPFSTVLIDITHRCNMECHNCYIPNRDIPDMDADWLYSILSRLPERTRIRLVGAEPTVRKDLPTIIRQVRRLGHTPTLLSNGLKLANRKYVQTLKEAGLRTLHISFNGGLQDDLYEQIDNLRCAKRKMQALDTLAALNMRVTAGMILVRNINDTHLDEFYAHLKKYPQVTDFHIRSVGKFGRHQDTESFSMPELITLFSRASGMKEDDIYKNHQEGNNFIDFKMDDINIQITEWPDLGNMERGRLTPEGNIEPFFEHVIANEGGY